jgi:hypothetical protein
MYSICLELHQIRTSALPASDPQFSVLSAPRTKRSHRTSKKDRESIQNSILYYFCIFCTSGIFYYSAFLFFPCFYISRAFFRCFQRLNSQQRQNPQSSLLIFQRFFNPRAANGFLYKLLDFFWVFRKRWTKALVFWFESFFSSCF